MDGPLTVTGRTACAGCDFGVGPIQNPEELGLAVNTDDGRVVIVEQAHKLYPDAYVNRYAGQRVRVSGRVIKQQGRFTWIEPTELIPRSKSDPNAAGGPAPSPVARPRGDPDRSTSTSITYIGCSSARFRDGRYRERVRSSTPSPSPTYLAQRSSGQQGYVDTFYAIFPGGSSHTPILLDGLLTSPEPIVNALRQAGPSRPMLASNLKIAPASGNDAGGF